MMEVATGGTRRPFYFYPNMINSVSIRQVRKPLCAVQGHRGGERVAQAAQGQVLRGRSGFLRAMVQPNFYFLALIRFILQYDKGPHLAASLRTAPPAPTTSKVPGRASGRGQLGPRQHRKVCRQDLQQGMRAPHTLCLERLRPLHGPLLLGSAHARPRPPIQTGDCAVGHYSRRCFVMMLAAAPFSFLSPPTPHPPTHLPLIRMNDQTRANKHTEFGVGESMGKKGSTIDVTKACFQLAVKTHHATHPTHPLTIALYCSKAWWRQTCAPTTAPTTRARTGRVRIPLAPKATSPTTTTFGSTRAPGAESLACRSAGGPTAGRSVSART